MDEGRRKAYRILVGKLKNWLLGRPGCKEGNIKIDLGKGL
jgi:hypothetical protein